MTTTRKPLTFLLTTIVALTLAASAASQQPTPAPDPISSIRNNATGILEAVKAIDPKPAPTPAEDWREYPKEPVSVGRFAVFQIADTITVSRWVAVARSTAYPDPAIHVDSNGRTALIETAVPGDYVVQCFGVSENTPKYLVAEFKVVGVGPVPPVPPVPPTPPVPPVVVGKRRVVVIYESADKTPALAILLTDLRVGDFETYRKSKQHTLEILDDELIDPAWQTVLGDLKLPALVVCDPVTNAVISKQALPATDDAIIESVKGTGG